MLQEKAATTTYPIHELLRARWSPRAFSSEPLPEDAVGWLMEAARWAPSSRNLQPWRFIVATKDDPDAYEKLLAVIKEGNRHWAKNAPLLMLTITRTETDGRVNGSALHDLGLAVANLTVQATAMGLGVHQMGGIYPEVAREQYGIPDEYAIHTGIAVGYRAEPDTLPDDLAEREKQPRDRQPLSKFVYREWETPSPLVED